MADTPKGYVIDEDTTDAYLDLPESTYVGGMTAAELAARATAPDSKVKPLSLPPLTDHGHMRKFQIRDENFGLALYTAETAGEALLDFFANHARAELRQLVELEGDDAAVVVNGVRYRAVATTREVCRGGGRSDRSGHGSGG